MNLTTQVETWRAYWCTASDPSDVQRQLQKLRWLEEFAFHSGSAIDIQQFRALQQQIETGEKKLAELNGEFEVITPEPSPGQTEWVKR